MYSSWQWCVAVVEIGSLTCVWVVSRHYVTQHWTAEISHRKTDRKFHDASSYLDKGKVRLLSSQQGESPYKWIRREHLSVGYFETLTWRICSMIGVWSTFNYLVVIVSKPAQFSENIHRPSINICFFGDSQFCKDNFFRSCQYWTQI